MAWSTWTVKLWLVHFAERTGRMLATVAVVKLIANISYTLITVATGELRMFEAQGRK